MDNGNNSIANYSSTNSQQQQLDKVGHNSQCFNTLWGHVWLPLIVAALSFVFFRAFQFAVRWYLFGKWTFPTFSYFNMRRRRRRRRNNDNNGTPATHGHGSAQPTEMLQQQPRTMDSKSLEIVPPNKKWRISNEFVSLFHSILSGFWALGILTHFDTYIDDLINADSKEARYLTYMSFGYLVHDFIDLVVNERSARIIELLFHHVVVLTAFSVTQVTCKFLYIVILGLLMEVNSIFLHSRSLCNLYRQPKDSNLFKIIAVLNIATFMLFRIAVSLVLIGWLIGQYATAEVAWYLQVVNSLVIYSLTVTNFVLCYRVLAADGLLGARRAPQRHRHQQSLQDGAGGDSHHQQQQQQSSTSEDDDDDDEEGPGGDNQEEEDEGLVSDYNNGGGAAGGNGGNDDIEAAGGRPAITITAPATQQNVVGAAQLPPQCVVVKKEEGVE